MAEYLQLKVLEDRLKSLEKQIGEKQLIETEEEQVILLRLRDVQMKLSAITTGREKIHGLWKRLDELNSLFDPHTGDKLTITDDIKADIIIAEEEHLREHALLLKEVESMKSVLDSEHVRDAAGMSDRLQPLGLVQIEQFDRIQNLSDDVKQLLEAYNNILLVDLQDRWKLRITLVSKQFVQWEETITQYEISKNIRKSNEFI